MKAAKGIVFKYGDNVDTDVIIPARYLNSSDPAELAAHCMEDIDKDFIKNVKAGDLIVADKNFGCGSSREHAPIAIKAAGVSCVIAETFARIPSLSVPRLPGELRREMRWRLISIPAGSETSQRERNLRDRPSLNSCRRSLTPRGW